MTCCSTNMKELTENVNIGNSGDSDHEVIEFKILRGRIKESSRIETGLQKSRPTQGTGP